MGLLDAKGEEQSVETVVHVAGPSAVNAENMNAPDTQDVDLPVDVVQELHRKIALLEQKVTNCKEIINELKNERKILLEQKFSLDKIKDDDSAILFTTVFVYAKREFRNVWGVEAVDPSFIPSVDQMYTIGR